MRMVPPASPSGQVAIQPETQARPSKLAGAAGAPLQPSGSDTPSGIGLPPTSGARQVTRQLVSDSGASSR